ncbi:hypothetical protein PDG61_29550 [Mycolicibacterium sp. BiH015]|uniref:hypothetical protein n=1 Tax=Mycolicibacterium sp. BiH015 TaxID=3018808 RepID=UPI0022E987EE|nr:hypothetical protein [Mycolicibacterium sp. BiH015]MDA2895091.1 hypothetical protein [Mycolicibacterium sp. BiH015]
MDLAGTYLVNTSDLDVASAILGPEYGHMSITRANPEAQPWIRIWRTRVGPMTLDDADITSDVRYDVDAPQGILLCRIRAGVVEFTAGEFHRTFRRGDMVAVVADGTPITVVMKEARCDLVSFAPALLEEMATLDGAALCGTPLKRFSDPITPSAGQQAADVIDHIRRFIANNPLVAHEPLVANSAARYLVATILTAFPKETLAV